MRGRVRVIYVGVVAEAIGVHIEEYEVGEATVSELLEAIGARHPGFSKITGELPLINIYVNGRHVGLNEVVRGGDEVVIAPPFYEGG